MDIALTTLATRKAAADADCVKIFKDGDGPDATAFKDDLAEKYTAAREHLTNAVKKVAQDLHARVADARTPLAVKQALGEMHDIEKSISDDIVKDFSKLLQSLGRQKVAASRRQEKVERDAAAASRDSEAGGAAGNTQAEMPPCLLMLLEQLEVRGSRDRAKHQNLQNITQTSLKHHLNITLNETRGVKSAGPRNNPLSNLRAPETTPCQICGP